MMKYEILTLQYGTYKDVSEYNNINEVLDDLALLPEMPSFQVLSVSKNGIIMSQLRLKILLALAKSINVRKVVRKNSNIVRKRVR